MDGITTATDFELSSTLFYCDVQFAEHAEIDCRGGGEFECTECDAAAETVRAVKAEIARREAAGIRIEGESLEERLGPYGTEWQIEQRERAEGYGY